MSNSFNKEDDIKGKSIVILDNKPLQQSWIRLIKEYNLNNPISPFLLCALCGFIFCKDHLQHPSGLPLQA